jgi:DNA-binding NtrC family response regulator
MPSTQPLVLIVDDKPDNLDVLIGFLAGTGLQLAVSTSGEEALEVAANIHPDLVLLDVMMPGMDGYEVCRTLKNTPQHQQTPVIFMSALSDPDSKVKGFAAGSVDFVSKPLHREEVLARIHNQLTIVHQQQQLQTRNQQLESLNRDLQEQINRRQQAEDALARSTATLSALTRQEAERWGIDAFIGQSSNILTLLEQIRDLQHAGATNVLVLGESGTGKELVSRAIHYGSPRRDQPFIAVNCSAIPAELADAEFFGHTRGAYTGATSDRPGYFEKADGGTLFLDEIGDMPATLQTKLLRVMEDGMVTPIGSQKSRRVDVRIVAATNVDLQTRVKTQQFRQDLYFRLAGYVMTLPPLRLRTADIPLLVQHFLTQLCLTMGREIPAISQQALDALSRYHYPGNVRELRNLIEFALIASRGQPIGLKHLHFMDNNLQSGPASDNTAAGSSVVTASLSTSEAVPAVTQTADQSAASSLLAYARQHGRIDNTSAQQLLEIDHGRASYLLKKLHREGHLAKQGERRWAYYIPHNTL